MEPPLLEARELTKSFPGVRALRGVSLALRRGEVLAVAGENGAGKSTLMKILAGVLRPDSGDLWLEGRPAGIRSVADALSRGIALIHQELNLAGNLDIAANLFLGREQRRFGLIDTRRQRHEARPLMNAVGLDLDPATPVAPLSPGQQQLVEIAKALAVDARILIFDEPTSSLSSGESQKLFEVIRTLRSRGVSIVYISHRLGEISELADRITVLRDGRVAGELNKTNATHDAMVRLMVGRESWHLPHRSARRQGVKLLETRGWRTAAHPDRPLDFSLHAGEIVGIAGLVGAGRTELLESLFGVTPPAGGTLIVHERPFIPESPQKAIEAGLVLVPEDRKRQGLILELTVRENLALPSLRYDQRLGLVNRRKVVELCRTMMETLDIRPTNDRQTTRHLSGGNQQKVVLGKWLARNPRILLLDEPTRGVDVGAKQEIYQWLEAQASRGLAILFASGDMEEIIRLSDRVLVMHEGALRGMVPRDRLDEETIMTLATGGTAAAA